MAEKSDIKWSVQTVESIVRDLTGGSRPISRSTSLKKLLVTPSQRKVFKKLLVRRVLEHVESRGIKIKIKREDIPDELQLTINDIAVRIADLPGDPGVPHPGVPRPKRKRLQVDLPGDSGVSHPGVGLSGDPEVPHPGVPRPQKKKRQQVPGQDD